MEGTGHFHAPAALPWGKSPWYPLDRRLGGPQRWSEHSGEEKNIPTPTRDQTLVIHQPVSYPNSELNHIHV